MCGLNVFFQKVKESLGSWRVDARCYQDVYVHSFFPRTARPWNYLRIECLTLPMILVALSGCSALHGVNAN